VDCALPPRSAPEPRTKLLAELVLLWLRHGAALLFVSNVHRSIQHELYLARQPGRVAGISPARVLHGCVRRRLQQAPGRCTPGEAVLSLPMITSSASPCVCSWPRPLHPLALTLLLVALLRQALTPLHARRVSICLCHGGVIRSPDCLQLAPRPLLPLFLPLLWLVQTVREVPGVPRLLGCPGAAAVLCVEQ
jgi:hypothetical protein